MWLFPLLSPGMKLYLHWIDSWEFSCPQSTLQLIEKIFRFFGLIFCWLLTFSSTFAIIFEYMATPKMFPFGNCFSIPIRGGPLSALPFHVYCPLFITTFTAIAISIKFMRDRKWKSGQIDATTELNSTRCQVAPSNTNPDSGDSVEKIPFRGSPKTNVSNAGGDVYHQFFLSVANIHFGVVGADFSLSKTGPVGMVSTHV